MKHTFELTDEQLEELESILSRELRESRIELRHTWASSYKERVRQHIETIESLLAQVEACKHGSQSGRITG